MRKRRIISVGLALVVIIGAVFFWMATRKPEPLKVGVLFLGLVNDTSGKRMAQLQVTNESDVRIRVWGVYHVQVRGEAQRRGPFFHGRNIYVAPGQSSVFLVPEYTEASSWCAALHCSRDNWRRSFSDFAGSLPPSLCRFVPRRYAGVPVEFALSDWIEKGNAPK
jgi:hypothetical protein